MRSATFDKIKKYKELQFQFGAQEVDDFCGLKYFLNGTIQEGDIRTFFNGPKDYDYWQ